MQHSFTLHCVPWQARAPLFKEIRTSAYEMGFLTQAETQTDQADERCKHALVLNRIGKALGCARITPEGNAERLTILEHENRTELESALKLAAWLNETKT